MSWLVIGGSDNLFMILKEYPYRSQAVAWCWLNGYVNSFGRHGYRLDGRVRIMERKNGTRSN